MEEDARRCVQDGRQTGALLFLAAAALRETQMAPARQSLPLSVVMNQLTCCNLFRPHRKLSAIPGGPLARLNLLGAPSALPAAALHPSHFTDQIRLGENAALCWAPAPSAATNPGVQDGH